VASFEDHDDTTYSHLSPNRVKDAVERIGSRIAAKLLPERESRGRLMRMPFMVPVPVLSKVTKLATDRGQTPDDFITEALIDRIAGLTAAARSEAPNDGSG
jgi:hypothetical protein